MSATQQIEKNVEWLSAANAPMTPSTASLRTGMSADWLPAASAAVESAVSTLDQGAGTEDLGVNAAPEVVARIAKSAFSAPSQTQFDLRQQWEGMVVEVGVDSFSVTLKDLTDPSVPQESAELFLEDVGDGDRELVEPGAVFYWSVGYEDTPRGRERKSIIRFRRLPGWSRQQMDAVKAKTAELSSYFVGDDSQTSGR